MTKNERTKILTSRQSKELDIEKCITHMDYNQAILGFLLSDLNIKNNSKKNPKRIWKFALMTPLIFITRIFIYVFFIPASQDIGMGMLILIIAVECFSTVLYATLFLFQRIRLKPFNLLAKLINSVCLLGFASSSLFNIVVIDDKSSPLWKFSFYLLLVSIFLEYFLSAVMMLSKAIISIIRLIQGQIFFSPIRKIIFYKELEKKNRTTKTPTTPKLRSNKIESQMMHLPTRDLNKVQVYNEVEEAKLSYKLAPRVRTNGLRATLIEKKMKRMKIKKPKSRNSKKFKRVADLSIIKSSPKVSRFSLKGKLSPLSLNNSFNSRTPQSRFNPKGKTPSSALHKERVARIDFKNWTPNLRSKKL